VSNHLSFFIAGLVPGLVPAIQCFLLGLDAQDKPAHDESMIQLDGKPL
jgi:hypothetical protein